MVCWCLFDSVAIYCIILLGRIGSVSAFVVGRVPVNCTRFTLLCIVVTGVDCDGSELVLTCDSRTKVTFSFYLDVSF